jgi:outer membrane protein assembly factor BamB
MEDEEQYMKRAFMLLMVCALIGCSGASSRSGARPVGQRYFLEDFAAEATLTATLSVSVEQGRSRAVLEGHYLALIDGASVVALNAATGKTLWRSDLNLGGDAQIRMTVFDGTAPVDGPPGVVFVHEPWAWRAMRLDTGELLWDIEDTLEYDVTDFLFDDEFLIGVGVHTVQVRSAISGAPLWSRDFDTDSMWDPDDFGGELALQTVGNGRLVATVDIPSQNPPRQTWVFDLVSGARQWYCLGDAVFSGEDGVFLYRDKFSEVLVRDPERGEITELIRIERHDGVFMRADADVLVYTSEQRYLDGARPEIRLDGTVVERDAVISSSHEMIAKDRRTDAKRWNFPYGRIASDFAIGDSVMAVTTPGEEGVYEVRDLVDGKRLFRFSIPGAVERILVSGRFVAALGDDGSCRLFEWRR